MAVNPTGADLKGFLESDPDAPVVMLNLLRFRPGGKELYDQYLAHLQKYSAKFGATVLYYGEGGVPLVAEAGQDWDAVLLVRYPSRRTFSKMLRDPDYQAGSHLRTDAVAEAVLQPTEPLSLPLEVTWGH